MSWLGYAFRFMQLPLGLFGASFASAILPSLSRSAAVNNLDEFRKTLAHSVGAVLVMTIPSLSAWCCWEDRSSEPFFKAAVFRFTIPNRRRWRFRAIRLASLCTRP